MKIILSSAPSFLLAAYCRKKGLDKWIYLGNNRRSLNKLNKILGVEGNIDISGESLYNVSQNLRANFVSWIDDLSLRQSGEKEWLFSVPSVKNTYSSNLFLYVCYFFLLKHLYFKKTISINWIIVDSPALGSMLTKEFPNDFRYLKVNYLINWILIARTGYFGLKRFATFLFRSVKQYISARIVFGSRSDTLSTENNILLIRQYILGDYAGSKDKFFRPHYFPGLENYLIEKRYRPVFLAITVQVKKYAKLYRKILNSGDQIIVPEEFFHISDYFHAFLMPIRAFRCEFFSLPLKGHSFENVLREDFYSNITDIGMMTASLYSRLGQRLIKMGISPAGIVNWHENQAFEKGLIHGLRLAIPKIEVIGSQPFIAPPNLLSIFPSKQDRLLSVTPDRILVLGPVLQAAIGKFDQTLAVSFTPAFRYSLTSICQLPDEKKDLLVLMGIDFDNAIQVTNLVIRAKAKLPPAKRVLIKLHPASPFSIDQLTREIGIAIPHNFEFVIGNLDQFLVSTSWGICGATGASLNLVARGIPVAIIGNNQSLTMNYLAYRQDLDLWRLCFTEKQLVCAGNYFYNAAINRPEELRQKGEEFKEAFLSPDSEDNWINYLVSKSYD